MKPEAKAREVIDTQLQSAGWLLQDYKQLDPHASLGVAVREFPGSTGPGDYALFVDGKVAGFLEAKAVGTTLSGVADQTTRYQANLAPHVARWQDTPPFGYESTGIETLFQDLRDPDLRSRAVFSFHTPKGMHALLQSDFSFRAGLHKLPELAPAGLRDCQVDAIRAVEKSLKANDPRLLLQMATGSGKTFTAVTLCYRLLKHAKAKRILFLVDRRNLGRQAKKEFEQYRTPDDGRTFKELYNIQHLTRGSIDPASSVVITTIQRLFCALKGDPDGPDDDDEERSAFEGADTGDDAKEEATPQEVVYTPEIPIETFDLIIVDECHRSIFNQWRDVLSYFDAFVLGLTATPGKQAMAFFNQNLVSAYPHESAVADRVNVPASIYRIKTHLTDKGGSIAAGTLVDKRDRHTRKKGKEKLAEEKTYAGKELDRSVVAPDQIRTVLKTFKEKLPSELFPDRQHVPKTLIFAKDDNHAEDIVTIAREVFGRGNSFCKKITYRAGADPDDLLAEFRNSFEPRIAVTVDMIATGTDIKPLECILFMRDVRSSLYYEQMKGRGTRVLDPNELQAVTPDAVAKTHFVLVDAVGVTTSHKHSHVVPCRKHYETLDKLMMKVTEGARQPRVLTLLMDRLARLQLRLKPEQLATIPPITGGQALAGLIHGLGDCLSPSKVRQKARETFQVLEGEEPTQEQVKEATKALGNAACLPFTKPALREHLWKLWSESEQIFDPQQDKVLYAGFDEEKAKGLITDWKAFMKEHADELLALEILYAHRHRDQRLTYTALKELAEAMSKHRPPLVPDLLWQAYAHLEKGRVKGASAQRLLTDLINLVRFTVGDRSELVPFQEEAEARFQAWVETRQAQEPFTEEQLAWLRLFKDRIITASSVELDDLDQAPFHQKGGKYKAAALFGPELRRLLVELSEILVA